MRGFTLIELLVTITIIVLVTGGSLAAYLTFNENRQLDIDARDFNSLLSRVRSRAIFLEYPDDCTGLTSFQFGSVDGADGLNDSVRYYANCVEGIRGETTEKILTASQFTADFSLVFLPSSGNLASGEDEVVVLQSTKGAQNTKSITISQFLNINNSIGDEE